MPNAGKKSTLRRSFSSSARQDVDGIFERDTGKDPAGCWQTLETTLHPIAWFCLNIGVIRVRHEQAENHRDLAPIFRDWVKPVALTSSAKGKLQSIERKASEYKRTTGSFRADQVTN